MGVFSLHTKAISSLNPLADSVGGLLNNLTGVTDSQNRTYQQQLKAMDKQNAYNTYMWNLQNEYNSPAAQLARMRDAGIDINPTSYALGTGNLSNTAALVGSASGFSGSGSPAGNPISALMGVASGVQGIRESKARTDNMEKQNENLTGVIESTRLENDIRRHNLEVARDTGMPVGSVPGMDASLGSLVNKGLTIGANPLYNHLTRPSTKSDRNYFREASEWIGDKIYKWTH